MSNPKITISAGRDRKTERYGGGGYSQLLSNAGGLLPGPMGFAAGMVGGFAGGVTGTTTIGGSTGGITTGSVAPIVLKAESPDTTVTPALFAEIARKW